MKLVKWVLLLAITCLAGCAVVPLGSTTTRTVVVEEGPVISERMIVE